jgi:hypothetical protein
MSKENGTSLRYEPYYERRCTGGAVYSYLAT